MSETISVAAVMRMAGVSGPASENWRTFIDSISESDARLRLLGNVQRVFPHLLENRRITLGTSEPGWLRAALTSLESELECWLTDIFAPLDYLALAVCDADRAGSPNFWTAKMAERTSHSKAPVGVRALPLASESLMDVVSHLQVGLVRQVNALCHDSDWVRDFLGRVDLLERWLDVRLEERLGDDASAALRSLRRARGWRNEAADTIGSLAGRVPPVLIDKLNATVAEYQASLNEQPSAKREAPRFAWMEGDWTPAPYRNYPSWWGIHGRPTRGR